MRRFIVTLTAALLFGLPPVMQTPAASASTVGRVNEETAQHTLYFPSLNPISIGLCNAGQRSHVISSVASGSGNGIALGIVDPLNPTVIVSENNKLVITSFPTTDSIHC